MKNAYLVLGYACNQKCRCCPITNNKDKEARLSDEQLEKEIKTILSCNVTDLTISGGEPTLHPRFFEVVEAFLDRGISVHVLSNGEAFSIKSFADKFLRLKNKGFLTVTTTFHSEKPEEHEYQNQSKGSFEKSMRGLRYLDVNGLVVSVKHCITRNNYKSLPSFVNFVMDNFSDNAEIQLWGIDLCGITEETARGMFVPYLEIKPYIETAIDLFEQQESETKRILNINNLPLCMCDSYYWKYFTPREMDDYISYKFDEIKDMEDNSGPISKNCYKCPFQHLCPGVYYSNFQMLGDDIVYPPRYEMGLINPVSPYTCYNLGNLSRLYFSPYTTLELKADGMEYKNLHTGLAYRLNLKTKELLAINEAFRGGVEQENIISMLDRMNVDGMDVINQLMYRGIIE